MYEVINYIFEEGLDVRLYVDQQVLIMDLIIEAMFPLEQVINTIDWFKPIMLVKTEEIANYNSNVTRVFDVLETKFLSHDLISKIIGYEQNGTINAYERDLLVDRLGIIAKEGIGEDMVEELLDYLIGHFNSTFIIDESETFFSTADIDLSDTLH